MSYRSEIQDDIGIFTIDNAPSNSISTEALKALEALIDRVNAEKELKGIVLTGTGRSFCGGYDLVTFTSFEGPDDIVKWFSDTKRYCSSSLPARNRLWRRSTATPPPPA